MPDEQKPDLLHETAAAYSTAVPTPEFLDELYKHEVLEARRMPPEQKLLAGQQLFEAACRITMAGIRNQFPEASEERCREILRERLELRRRLEKCDD
jgi:hypothetical protein